MLQKNSITLSYSLAAALAAKRMTLDPSDNTLLSKIVGLTNGLITGTSGLVTDPSAEFELESWAAIIETITNGDINAPTAHDAAIDELNIVIANSIRAHLSYAKNVVNPVITALAEASIKYIEAMGSTDASSKFNLVIKNIPTIFLDKGFTNTLSFFNGKTPVCPALTLNLAPKTATEVLEAMLTRDKDTDKDITSWYTMLGEDFFVKVWNSFFGDAALVGNSFTSGYLDGLDSFNKADIALCIYLVSRKLAEEVDASAAKTSLVAYQKTMYALRDFSGAMLTECIKAFDRYVAFGTLVLNVDKRNSTATVVGSVYQNWVATGGRPETLFGLIVSGKNIYSVKAIDAVAVELDQQWRSYSLFFNANEVSKSLSYFKDALRIQFRNIMDNITEAEQDFIKTTDSYAIKVNEYFERELSEVTLADMQNIYITCLKLVCRARFYYTDAEKILLSINTAGVVNPGIDVREAALLATVEYITDYFYDQTTLSTNVG